MLKRISKTLCIVLVFAMFFSSLPNVPLFAAGPYDGTASSWALPEIEDAEKNGLTYPGILSNFQRDITREEFCMISVKLYEALSGEKAAATGDPFSDTKNPEVIKAYNLGIVAGTGAGMFTPDKNIARQELAAMIYRTLDKSLPGLSKALINHYTIADRNKISDWAIESVEFCFDRSIIVGIGGGVVDPFSNTTREQAIAIINRTYLSFSDSPGRETFSDEDAGIVVNEKAPAMSEKEKFENLDWENRLAYPVFDTKIKINTVGVQGSSATKAISYGNFIDSGGNKKVDFAFSVDAPDVSRVVWQVSEVQYNGFDANWKNPGGLLTQGEAAPAAGKFTVDFGAQAIEKNLKGFGARLPAVKLPGRVDMRPLKIQPTSNITAKGNQQYYSVALGLPKKQKAYYVRAVPVNASGQPIGDPGLGLQVLYGEPLSPTPPTRSPLVDLPTFELWTTASPGAPCAIGEFRNIFMKRDVAFEVGPGADEGERWFQWNDFDSETYKVVLQVSTESFRNSRYNWENPTGLVYDKAYILSEYTSEPYANSAPIDFQSFSPGEAELGDNAIQYYVQAVALQPDQEKPGTVIPRFSQPVKITYKKQVSDFKYFIPKTITVPSNAPIIEKISYTPVQFEVVKWQEYYEVFRAPACKEVNFKVKNGDTGEILYPYNYGITTYKGISPAQYETEIVPKFLYEGSELRIKEPTPAKKHWWEKLYDAVVNFFTQLYDLAKKLVNWVHDAYENMKKALVHAVASIIPAGPVRALVESAMTYLVEAGLAAIGLPPSLPNFDSIMDMGKEFLGEGYQYAVKVALQYEEKLGVNDVDLDEIKGLAKNAAQQAAQAAKESTPNPIDAPFLRPSQSRIYRPAYIDIKVKNPSAANISPPGSIFIEMNAATIPRIPIYEPLVGEPLPALLPGEELSIRFFLKEYVGVNDVGSTYPNGNIVLSKDFFEAYFSDGTPKSKLQVSIYYHQPVDAETEAKRLGLDNIPNQGDYLLTYEYDRTYYTNSTELIPRYEVSGF